MDKVSGKAAQKLYRNDREMNNAASD